MSQSGPDKMPSERPSGRPVMKVLDVEETGKTASDEELRNSFPENFDIQKYLVPARVLLDSVVNSTSTETIIAESIRVQIDDLYQRLLEASFSLRIEHNKVYYQGQKKQSLTALVSLSNTEEVLDSLNDLLAKIEQLIRMFELITIARRKIAVASSKINLATQKFSEKTAQMTELIQMEELDRFQGRIEKLKKEGDDINKNISEWEDQRVRLSGSIDALLIAVGTGDREMIAEELIPLENNCGRDCKTFSLRPKLQDVLARSEGTISYTANYLSVKEPEVKKEEPVESPAVRSRRQYIAVLAMIVLGIPTYYISNRFAQQYKERRLNEIREAGEKAQGSPLDQTKKRVIASMGGEKKINLAVLKKILSSKDIEQLYMNAFQGITSIKVAKVVQNKENGRVAYVTSQIAVGISPDVRKLAQIVYGTDAEVSLIVEKGVVIIGTSTEGLVSLSQRQFCDAASNPVSIRVVPMNIAFNETVNIVPIASRLRSCGLIRDSIRQKIAEEGASERTADGNKVLLSAPETGRSFEEGRNEVIAYIMVLQRDKVLPIDFNLEGAMTAENFSDLEKWLVGALGDQAVEVNIKKGKFKFGVSKILQEGLSAMYGRGVLTGVEQSAHQKSAAERQRPMTGIGVPKKTLCSPSFDLGIVIQPEKSAKTRGFYGLDLEPFRKKYCNGK